MRPLAALLLALAFACAPRLGDGDATPRVDRFTIDGSTFRIVYLEEDAQTARDFRAILGEAVPKTRRWGDLKAPVTITIHPSHEALEAAVHREGYEWLRAWARYASIDVQSPRTWSLFGAGRQQVSELVLHELTHCVMYQNAGTDWSWAYKQIPLWFREGLASVTAEQGYRRPGPEPIWRFYQGASPGAGDGAAGGAPARSRGRNVGDPLTDPEPLYQGESDLVYGTAHLAFEFLVQRYGEAKVQGILGHMREGDFFPAAFKKAIGISAEEFEREFRRYVAWEGWRTAP